MINFFLILVHSVYSNGQFLINFGSFCISLMVNFLLIVIHFVYYDKTNQV